MIYIDKRPDGRYESLGGLGFHGGLVFYVNVDIEQAKGIALATVAGTSGRPIHTWPEDSGLVAVLDVTHLDNSDLMTIAEIRAKQSPGAEQPSIEVFVFYIVKGKYPSTKSLRRSAMGHPYYTLFEQELRPKLRNLAKAAADQ